MGNYPLDNDEFVKEFFKRTLHNLDTYLEDHTENKRKYPYDITQIINSFLGLIVFLKDSSFLDQDALNDFVLTHPPEQWICMGSNNQSEEHNFPNYIKRLRNAISHRNITSIPDETNLIIALQFKDGYNGGCFDTKLSTEDILVLIYLLKESILNEDN